MHSHGCQPHVIVAGLGRTQARHAPARMKARASGLRIVLLGGFGRVPFAGMAWETLFYLEGFRRLGHDVYYVEDSAHWPYYATKDTTTEAACQAAADYIARMLAWCGMPDRWAYRTVAQDDRVYGLSEQQFSQLFQTADVVINLAGSTWLRDEHLRVPVRVYLETDPGCNEIQAAQGDPEMLRMLAEHTHHYIFAENLGAPDCRLPAQPVEYRHSRNPVVLEWFTPPEDAPAPGGRRPLRFTTVGNWDQSGHGFDIEWQGEVYTWSKHHEFLKFLELPSRIGHPVELALGSITKGDVAMLRSHGWQIVEAYPLSRDILPYREYIWASDGEFTVAKDQNVRLRTGWFSDRSAEYLAAGRPVITQDTAFGSVLPTGAGLFAFNSMEDIVGAFEAVQADYATHSRAARDIAEEYFRAETVLARFIDDLGGARAGGGVDGHAAI
jgi:hypothetical protein